MGETDNSFLRPHSRIEAENKRLRALNAELVDAVKLMIAARDRPHGFPDNPWYDDAFAALRAALSKAESEAS